MTDLALRTLERDARDDPAAFLRWVVEQDRVGGLQPAASGLVSSPRVKLSSPRRVRRDDYEGLRSLGWPQLFAAQVASAPSDQMIPRDIRDEFLDAIADYFDGDMGYAMTLWKGTGFTPRGPRGPSPNMKQVRRFMSKIDWRGRWQAITRNNGAVWLVPTTDRGSVIWRRDYALPFDSVAELAEWLTAQGMKAWRLS